MAKEAGADAGKRTTIPKVEVTQEFAEELALVLAEFDMNVEDFLRACAVHAMDISADLRADFLNEMRRLVGRQAVEVREKTAKAIDVKGPDGKMKKVTKMVMSSRVVRVV